MERDGKTATEVGIEQHMWGNLRRQRADAFVNLTMKAIDQFIPHESRRDAYESLYSAYLEAGIDALTDEDRAKAGLSLRDKTGWTAEELRILEAKRLEYLLRPIQIPAFPVSGEL